MWTKMQGSFAFLMFCFIRLSSTEAGLLSVPLRRMKSPLQEMAARNIHPKKIDQWLRQAMSASNGTSSVPLSKFLDMEFYGEVLLGHPGQKFNVAFDTTWANSWVPSSLCGALNVACRMHNQYDSTRSSKYVPDGRPFNIDFGFSNLTGRLSTDLMHIGHVNITNQTFAEIMHVPWVYVLSKADGVLGLAFDAFAIDNVTPFFYNMLKQQTIQKGIFSIYMNRDPSSPRGGTIFFGGVEERHFKGNFTFAPIVRVGYWEFPMDSVNIKGLPLTLCKGGCTAIADTSSNAIEGPAKEINAIHQYFNATEFYFNRYLVNCSARLPTVTFTIRGRPFVLKSNDFVQRIAWGGVMVCLSSFKVTELPSSMPNVWTLGGAFLSRFYVQFNLDDKKIGFADALL